MIFYTVCKKRRVATPKAVYFCTKDRCDDGEVTDDVEDDKTITEKEM